MKTQKYSLYAIILITLFALYFLLTTPNNQILYDISLGLISGNIVAITLILIEYFNERKQVLSSFYQLATSITSNIGNNIKTYKLIPDFREYFINDDINNTHLHEIVGTYISCPKNQKSLEKIMDSFIKVSTLDTIELGDLFNEYHTLKPVREVNDCVRKQLYNSFNEIRNFLEEIFILSFHFKTELESDSINYENILYRLLEFTKDKYDFENKDDCTIVYTKFKFDLDQPVNKIHQILNSNFDAYTIDKYICLKFSTK